MGISSARLQIIIDALDNASDDLKKLNNELGKTDDAAKKTEKGFGGFGKGLNAVKAVAGAFVVREGLRLINQLGEMGAQAERVENSFIAVSGSAEDAERNLLALKEATRGAVDDAALMEGATSVLALGLADTSDELATITRNVAALGAKFGGTMQIFQLMMSNKSLMRIDSFGLGVEEVTKRIDELVEAGANADDAFDTAVLELMTQKYEELGGAMDDNQLKIEQGEAAWKNMTTAIGKSFSGAVASAKGGTAELTQGFADLLDRTNDAREEFGYFKGTLAGMADLLGINGNLIDQMEDDYYNVENATQAAAAATDNWRVSWQNIKQLDSQEAMDAYNTAMRQSAESTDYMAGRMIYLEESTMGSAEAFDIYSRALDESDQAYEEAGFTQRELNEAVAAAEIAFLNAAAGLGELKMEALAYQELEILKQSLDAGKISLEQYRAATDSVLTGMGLLTEAERGAQKELDFIRQRYEDGRMSADEYADAIARIKNRLDTLEDKTINVKFLYTDEDRRQGAGAGYSSEMWDPNYQAVGGVSAGGWTMVGEQGPERVNLPQGASVMPAPVTNNYFNTTVNTRATTASYTQDIAWARMIAG